MGQSGGETFIARLVHGVWSPGVPGHSHDLQRDPEVVLAKCFLVAWGTNAKNHTFFRSEWFWALRPKAASHYGKGCDAETS
jgi:hypothetical protein